MLEANLLDDLLSAAINEIKSPKSQLKQTDIFSVESNIPTKSIVPGKENEKRLVHTGDTDSSDDEDDKYHDQRKYSDYGREIKRMLEPSVTKNVNTLQAPATWNSNLAVSKAKLETLTNKVVTKSHSVETDPIFGLRIVNPVVSSTALQERMIGREAVSFFKIKKFVAGDLAEKNWVIGAVVVNKSTVKTSQKGKQFLIWTLSDLKDDIKTVSMFLFGSAYKQFWKTAVGTIVGILNPTVFNKKDGSKDEACLSVDTAQKVMILGQSKDLGTCRSTKKNGEPCSAIVNVNRCEFCVYHIKQEYQKASRRSELQSSFAGRGLTALRNKVLGKNEVFYAGKSYMAIPARKSKKLEKKDEGRLKALNGLGVAANNTGRINTSKILAKKGAATALEISHSQRLRDMELLRKLGGDGDLTVKTNLKPSLSVDVTIADSKATAVSVISKLKEKVVSPAASALYVPKLTLGNEQGIIDLNSTVPKKIVNRAKLNALQFVKNNGPLKKVDPNSVKPISSKKRTSVESCSESDYLPDHPSTKKPKIEENKFLSDRYKKMMEATSKHKDLLDSRDEEEQEKYFYKLEAKERMEEKMVSTYKMACKAVRCLKCKYTSFSASQNCKDAKHPLKVFDAVKRFFECTNCKNRTACLEFLPTVACNNCGCGTWKRTGMMKEKTVVVSHNLSIRGGEQKFVNSVATDANVDLLVPDD